MNLDEIGMLIEEMRMSMDFDNHTLDILEMAISMPEDLYNLEQVAIDMDNYEFPEPVDAPDFPHGEVQ